MTFAPNITKELRAFKDLNFLSEDDISDFIQALRPFKADAGEELLRYGIREKYYFLLLDGEVDIHTQMLGLDILLHKVSKHQSFGHGALVEPSTKLKFITAQPCNILVLPAYVHHLALEQAKSWAIKLQKSICFQVIKQMRTTLSKLSSLASDEKDTANISHEQTLINLLRETEISTGDPI